LCRTPFIDIELLSQVDSQSLKMAKKENDEEKLVSMPFKFVTGTYHSLRLKLESHDANNAPSWYVEFSPG